MHSVSSAVCFGDGSSSASRDLDLVRAARGGSAAAFAQLHELYGRRLYRKIFSITRNHEDTEDVLQDTMIRAYLALDSFEGRSQFASWLTRIAINSALMELRKRRTRSEVAIEPGAGSDDECPHMQFSDSGPSPEEVCVVRERKRHFARAMASLSPAFRRVMELQTNEERSMKEIAETLQVTVPTVKARLHRARRRVAEQLALQTARSNGARPHRGRARRGVAEISSAVPRRLDPKNA